jgi:hypothetical protein
MVRLGYVVRVCMCGGGQKGIVIGGQVGLYGHEVGWGGWTALNDLKKGWWLKT